MFLSESMEIWDQYVVMLYNARCADRFCVGWQRNIGPARYITYPKNWENCGYQWSGYPLQAMVPMGQLIHGPQNNMEERGARQEFKLVKPSDSEKCQSEPENVDSISHIADFFLC
jgi:hypothetical protein